jgi:hypothetical protein
VFLQTSIAGFSTEFSVEFLEVWILSRCYSDLQDN